MTRPTLTEAFERIVTASRDGWLPALVGKPIRQCAYRADGGRACPVGLFLPDDQFSPEFNGRGWTALPASVRVRFLFPDDFTDDTPAGLQDAHDRLAFDPDGWDHPGFVRRLLTVEPFDRPEFRTHPLVQELPADDND